MMRRGFERRGDGSAFGPRSVAIVGNAPEMADQAARIDAADWVVRFNNAAGFGGCAGRRVTHLVLVNHGGQMREWLSDPAFTRRSAVQDAETILFPFGRKPLPPMAERSDTIGPDCSPSCFMARREQREEVKHEGAWHDAGAEPSEDEDGRCWTWEAEVMLAPLGKRVEILPAVVRDEAEAILGSNGHPPPPPSTGFLVALYLARTLPAAVRIDIHGFGFAGWSGHAWERERQWFESQAAAGRLTLRPLEEAPAA